ncbi:MAG: deoxyribodipyrimidine photo-lyase, partial [Bacteroidales bacterium]
MDLSTYSQPERITLTPAVAPYKKAGKIIYRMRHSVRTKDNLALDIARAMSLSDPKSLEVVYLADPSDPKINYRQALFLSEGLQEVAAGLNESGIAFTIRCEEEDAFAEYLKQEAAYLITEKSYIPILFAKKKRHVQEAPFPVLEVEDNLLIPVESASDHAEWAARTLRPRLLKKLEYFTERVASAANGDRNDPNRTPFLRNGITEASEKALAEYLRIKRTGNYVPPGSFRGGENKALELLSEFAGRKLSGYDTARNHPELSATSRLSPYLHFGMISPRTI